MQVKEAIQLRRSIKHFDTNHVMTEKEIHELLSHAILSPTAFNIQNWRFVVVTDQALRHKSVQSVGVKHKWKKRLF